MATGAVKVHVGVDAERIRAQRPSRILTSRMVRRWKPQEGVRALPKAKSLDLRVYSPTPQVETLNMFLQIGANYGFGMAVADMEKAFCQSRPLNRAGGPVYVQPCRGLDLGPDAVIELLVAVYGAPLEFGRTVVAYLIQCGFQRALLDPCLRFERKKGQLKRMVLLDVDDLILMAPDDELPIFRKLIERRFKLDKYQVGSADFAGRQVRRLDDRILIDMEKYIMQELRPVKLAKGRRADKNSPLLPDEMKEHRTLIYQCNWIGREVRP